MLVKTKLVSDGDGEDSQTNIVVLKTKFLLYGCLQVWILVKYEANKQYLHARHAVVVSGQVIEDDEIAPLNQLR